MSSDATITFTIEHDVDVKLAYLSSLQDRRMPMMRRITELVSIIIIIILFFQLWLKQKIGLFDHKQASPEPRLENRSAGVAHS